MPQYDPAAFHEVFATLTNLPIVGGMAVNLWAEIYGTNERLLDDHRPELQRTIAKLPADQLQNVAKFVRRLKKSTSVARQRQTSRIMRDMDAGRKYSQAQVEAILARSPPTGK